MEWDQWVILIFGPTAVAASMVHNPTLRKAAPVLGLLGQSAWFYTLIAHQQWGGVIAGVGYTTAWGMGLWNLWQKEIRNIWFDSLASLSILSSSLWRREDSLILSVLFQGPNSKSQSKCFDEGKCCSSISETATTNSTLRCHSGS